MKTSVKAVGGVNVRGGRGRAAVALMTLAVGGAWGLFGGEALAGTQVFSPTFETGRQSIWGTGQAAISLNLQNQFLGARWGQPDQGGPMTGQVAHGNYTSGNGFRLLGQTWGRVGLEYGLKIDSGSIDASLPWDISVTTPNANTLVTGQKFVVDTAASFRANDATFVTRSPTFQMYSDFVFDVAARMSGQASMDLGFFNKQVTFDKQIIDVSARQELIAINRDNDGGVRVLPFLFSSASNVKEAYDNAQATKELKQELDQTTGRREKVKVTLRKMGVSFDLGSPVEASIRLPYIEMNGSSITRSGNKIKQSDKDGFAEFTFDLDRIASILQPSIPPMTVNADLDFVVGTLSTSATLIDVDFVPTLNLTQTAEVEARRVKIDMDLGTNRAYRVLDAAGNPVSSGTGRTATLTAGQKLELTYDGSDMNLMPTYRVEAGLQNQFGLSISSQLQFRALMASLEARLFGLELGGFSLGPAFETAIDFPDVSLGNLFDQTFDLEGFGAIAGPAVFISDKPAVFTGVSGGAWSTNANWTVGSSSGINPDIGRSAIVPAGKSVVVSGAGNASFHLEVGVGSTVNVNSQFAVGGSIYNSGVVNLGTGQILNLEEDVTAEGRHTLYGGTFNLASQSQVLLKNSGATAAINADLTITNTTLNIDNAAIKLQGGPGKLWLGNGATLNVRNAGGNPANQSVIGTVDGYGLDIVKYGARPVAVKLTQGANLLVEFGSMSTVFPDQNPTPAELKSTNAAVLADMLTFDVGNGSTLSLKGAAIASNLNSYSAPGTIVGARFVTSGTGLVKNVGSIKIAASRFDGDFTADVNDNGAGLNTTFQGLGSTTGELTPVVNNGVMTFVARPSRNNTIFTDNGAVAGTGEMRLIGYSNPVVMKIGGTDAFTNVEGHTIRVDNANIGNLSAGGGSFRFFNKGSLIADKNFGSNTGNLYFDNGNDSTGDVINTGLIRAQNGATISFRDANYLLNNGAVEAGDLSTVSVVATAYNITSPNSATVVLQGGSWKTEYSGRIQIGGFQISSISTVLSNKSELEVSANFASAAAGIAVRRTGGSVVRVEQFPTFRNESLGSFRASTASTVNFTNFENYGFLDVSNSTVTGVRNFAGGTILGSGEVRMQQTSPGVAAVFGTVMAARSENNAQLTVSAPAGVTTIQNNGVMGALGGDLVFPAGLFVASSGGTLTGGKWAVQGGTAAYPDSARIIIPLSGSNLTGLTNTSITLTGPGAALDSSNNGASFRSIQATLTTLNSGAILKLDNNAQTFANRVAINSGGQLLLANGGSVSGTGLDVYGLVEGTGTVNAPIKTYGGTVAARNGLLTITSTVDNTAVVGGFSGTLLANDPGAVLNPRGGADLNGGRLIINSIGAGLYGSGLIRPATFENKGVVAADTGILEFAGSGSFTNTGMMTTRERGRLNFTAITLNNSGGTVSAVDTNGLDLQSDGGGIGGTVRLRGATIQGGSVLISGYTAFAGGSTNAVSGVNARLDGYGSLRDVTLNVSRSAVVVDPTLVPGGSTLNITPAAGVPAVFYSSTVTASNGGNITFNAGTYSAIGSTLTATDNAFINLDGARLEDAKIVTSGTGAVRVFGTAPSTIANVKNTGTINVIAGSTLAMTGTVDSRGGTLRNNGTVSLSNADLVGGNVINASNSTILVPGRAQILGSNLTNLGTLRVNPGGDLTVNQSSDGTTSASTLGNFGTMSIAGQMRVLNSSFSSSGSLTVDATGSLTATEITQTGGVARVNGTASVTTGYYLYAGTLYGAGRITGRLYNYGGSVQPGNSPGTLILEGGLESADDSEYVMQVEFTDTFDRIVATSGDIHLDGRLILDFSSVLPEALGAMLNQQVSFDLFDVAPGYSIINDGMYIQVDGGGQILSSNVSFDPATGAVSLYIAPIPEPAALGLVAVPALAMGRRRRR